MDELELGYELREERQRRDLTQQDVASAAGLSTGTVINIEGGKSPSLATLQRILTALGAKLRISWSGR